MEAAILVNDVISLAKKCACVCGRAQYSACAAALDWGEGGVGWGGGGGIVPQTFVLKGEVQSRITIISKERVKISLQIGSKIMKIG